MASKFPETVNFTDEKEYNLFLIVVKKYNMGKSEFIRKIVCDWLFNNKLQIENYNAKPKQKGTKKKTP